MPEERRALEHRAESLRPHLAPFARPTQDDDVAIALAEMFNGFPSLRGDAGSAAMARVNAAMEVLAEFPLWAIETACMRIRQRGYEVPDHDRGGVKVERHWPPSEAELHRAVAQLVEPRANRMRNARLLLAAPVEPEPEESPERKAAVVDRLLGEVAALTVMPAELEAALATRNTQRAESATRRRDESVRAEYVAAGVEVPDGYLVSLSMRLAQGWTVEDVGDRKVLVRPKPKPSAATRETNPGEMGS